MSLRRILAAVLLFAAAVVVFLVLLAVRNTASAHMGLFWLMFDAGLWLAFAMTAIPSRGGKAAARKWRLR